MRRILLLTFLFFTHPMGYAQEQVLISKSEYEVLVDSINYEYLNFLLTDNGEKTFRDGFKSLQTKDFYASIIEFLDRTNVGDRYVKIATEINSLKKGYVADNYQLKQLLTEDIYADITLQEFNRAHTKRLKKENYRKFMDNLLANVEQKLEPSKVENDVLNEPTPTNVAIEETPAAPQKTSVKRTRIFYLVSGTLGFVSGILTLIILGFRRGGRSSKLKSRTHTEQAVGDLSKEAIDRPSRIEIDQRKKIQDLQNEIDRLKNLQQADRIDQENAVTWEIKNIEISPMEETNNSKIEQPVPEVEHRSLYFPNPTADGFFLANNSRPFFIEATSIFKFALSTPSEATFTYCDDPSSVKIALNNRNLLLLSVADELNAYNPEASMIIAEVPGIATLEGDIWKVTQKAKIKYC